MEMNKAENLKQLRKKAKLTQMQLAEKSKLNIGTIQGYEQGRYEPKYDAYKKLSEALNVDMRDLVGIEPVAHENVIYQDENFVILSNTREIKENQIDRIKYDLLMDTKEVE